MSDVWSFWREALAGEAPLINANAPQPGFYRKRNGKGGPWVPVMIRHDAEGRLRCRVGSDSDVDPHDVWTWCAANPISKDAAKAAFETGSFPGEVPTVGDNSKSVTPLDLLRDYIETVTAWLKRASITDQKSVDEAANYAAELARLKGDADRERDTKIRPHLDAQREINGEYKPLIEDADALVKRVKAASTAFLAAEKRRLEAEARAKYEAERKAAEAERQRIEAERAKLMQDDPIAALTSDEPELPMPPPPPEPVKVQAGGQRGKKMGLRTYTVYEVTDYSEALAWAATHPEVVAVVEKVCKAAARDGMEVGGVTKRQEERAA